MRRLVNPKLLMSSSKTLTTMMRTMMTRKMDPFSSRDLKENNKLSILAPKKKMKKSTKRLMKITISQNRLNSENTKIRNVVKKTEISILTIYDENSPSLLRTVTST